MAEFYSRWDLRRNLVIKLILFLSGPETPFPLGVFTNAGLHHAIGQWWIWGPDGRMADAGPVTQAPNTRWWPPLHHVRSSLNEMSLPGCAYANLCFPNELYFHFPSSNMCVFTLFIHMSRRHIMQRNFYQSAALCWIFSITVRSTKNINISLKLYSATRAIRFSKYSRNKSQLWLNVYCHCSYSTSKNHIVG